MTLPERPRGPVLVTGASGFVGRHVVAFGSRLGAEVHAVARTASVPGAVRTWPVDLRDGDRVRAVVAELRPRAVLHLAAAGVVGSGASVADLLAVNAVGLATVLEAARALDPLPDVVVAGSGLEYASQARPLVEDDPVRPASAYAASKAAASVVAAWFGAALPVTVLRLFGVYGPGERPPRLVPHVVERARRNEPVDLTPGEQVRDFVFVEDAAAAFWAALARPALPGEARIVNIGSGEGITLRQFAEALGAALRARGMAPELRFGARAYRADEPMVYRAAVAKAEAALGWRARTPIAEGLARTVEACLGSAR